MKNQKGEGPELKVLRILNSIPSNLGADHARQVELCRQDDLVEQAVSLVLKNKATPEIRDHLRSLLHGALNQHLERLEDEARQGKYREVSSALWKIHGASSCLLSLLNHVPIAALDRLQDAPGAREELNRLVEWPGAGGRDMPLGTDREVFEMRPPDSRRSQSGLVRRLAALEKLAKLAAESVEAEAVEADSKGAKSIRQAKTGRTPELDLFEDCTRILGPMKKLARLTAVAGLLHEAATGVGVSPSWGRDHLARARRWWRAVGPHVGIPLSRVPEAKRGLVEVGLLGIVLPKRRGLKSRALGKQGEALQSKATRQSGAK